MRRHAMFDGLPLTSAHQRPAEHPSRDRTRPAAQYKAKNAWRLRHNLRQNDRVTDRRADLAWTETFLQPAKPASRSMNQKAATLPIA